MNKNTVRIVATVMMLMLIACGATAYLAYNEVQEINKERVVRIDRVKEMQWQYVVGVLREHQLQANDEAGKLKTKIRNDIVREYGNDSKRLSIDIESHDPSSPIYAIAGTSVINIYHGGIKNDNNDPFVGTNSGVISDKSFNCSENKETRSWDEEIKLHWNKQLAVIAINALLSQRGGTIFWEFLPPARTNHKQLTIMSLDEMKIMFFDEGMSGLSGYEFLQASYIDPKSDMFGVPDVSNNGIRLKNNKIIVVQGFNIYDVLETYHKSQLIYFDSMKQQVTADTESRSQTLTVGATMLCFVLFACFGGVIIATRSKGGC